MPWSPTSWQSRPVTQQPSYPDAAAAAHVVEQLGKLPPLVTSWEIEALKSQLAEAAAGRRFLLQGGDCAESFEDCEPSIITNKLKILLQMSLVLVHGLKKRVIRVGRFAGQYAKPRSNDLETRNGESLPAYRGDIVNRADFSSNGRTPDPQNMLRGYERAALTLNFIRALIDGGFADLHHPEYWDLGFVKHSPRAAEYQAIVQSIGDSLRFMETLAGQTVGEMSRVDFYTSHEGLHLLYEQAQTRQVPRREGWYNLSTHFPWIGMRTAIPGNAHVEYFRGIRNPIAVKIGPPPSPPPDRESLQAMRERITRLLDVLHPDNEPGRLTLIHRFGAHEIAKCLPVVIDAVKSTGKSVLWVCDPMHGNTQTAEIHRSEVGDQRSEVRGQKSAKNNPQRAALSSTPQRAASSSTRASRSSGDARREGAARVQTGDARREDAAAHMSVKTRKFDHILAELEQAFDIHKSHGTYLGGVHFELTGDNVTECTGGARGVVDADLSRAYKSQVDPRLNYEQALEMALLIARRGS